MKIGFIKIIKNLFKAFDLSIIRYSTLEKYKKFDLALNYLNKIPGNRISKIYELIDKSKSQIYQDLFVLNELNFKRNGFFVEFGATNGVTMSNTYILEKEFGWNGILAEPAICWHTDLKNNRNCYIETKCVWKESKKTLKFNEVSVAEYSTVDHFMQSDNSKRISEQIYNVETISLIDMLKKYNAPKKIDYLSIDTEGSEYEILRSFDFNMYDISIITCEHNLTSMRDKVNTLLTKHGYERKYLEFSRWDDWYVKENK